MRKFRMIDASTLKMPGPVIVLRPRFPHVPAGFCTNAALLNHCRTDCSPSASSGLTPVEFGRSWPPPVFELSGPEYIVLGKPVDLLMIALICHPPRSALPKPS